MEFEKKESRTKRVLRNLGSKQGHYFWLLPLILYIAAVGSVKLIRLYDPTAGAFDPGIWQSAIVPFVFVLIANICTLIILRFNMPSKFNYLIKGDSSDDFDNKLTPWQKTVTTGYWFSLFYLSLLALILKLI